MINEHSIENITYREVQRFRQTWIWVLVALPTGIAWCGFLLQIVFGKPFGSNPAPDLAMGIIWLAFGIALPLFIYLVRLIVEVGGSGIEIRFFPLHSRTIPFDNLRSYEVRKYRPVRDYGGWGIKWSSGKGWAYNVSGNRGVQLELSDGKRILIGSQTPEELTQMIGKAVNK